MKPMHVVAALLCAAFATIAGAEAVSRSQLKV